MSFILYIQFLEKAVLRRLFIGFTSKLAQTLSLSSEVFRLGNKKIRVSFNDHQKNNMNYGPLLMNNF